MTTISRSALVLHSADTMYDLINDVELYPTFLPYCVGSTVHEKHDHEMIASLEVERGGIRQIMKSHNYLHRPHTIRMELVEGPFTQLTGHWEIRPLTENACKVSLDLVFEFSNKLAYFSLIKTFEAIANKLVDAFCKRADDIDGK